MISVSHSDIKEALQSSDWAVGDLAVRWGLSTRRVRQIIADIDPPAYYGDAIGHVVTIPVSRGQRKQMSPDEIHALLAERQISPSFVARRWRLSLRRVGQMITSEQRPLYLDDAFLFLPAKQKSATFQLLESKGWHISELSKRWGIPALRLAKALSAAKPNSYWYDGVAGLPKRNDEGSPSLNLVTLRDDLLQIGWSCAALSRR